MRSTVWATIAGILLAFVLQLGINAFAATGDSCGGSGQPACPQLDGYLVNQLCASLGYPPATPCPMVQWSQWHANTGDNTTCLYVGSNDASAVLASNLAGLVSYVTANQPALSPIGSGYSGTVATTTVAGDCSAAKTVPTSAVFFTYACGDGSRVQDPGSCSLIACTDKGGKFVDYRDDAYGGQGVARGTVDAALLATIQGQYAGKVMCVGGCRVRTTSAQCFVRNRNAEADDVPCDGTGMYLNESCIGSDKVLQAQQTFNERGLLGNTGNDTGTSGGGAGVSGGTDANAINLARIATNTANLAQGLNRPVQVFVQGSTPGEGGGSTCGGPGQPACNTDAPKCGGADQPACTTDIEGTGAANAGTALITQLDGLKGEALNALKGAEDALKSDLSAAPNFGGDGSRWKWGLAAFIGAGSGECSHTWNVAFPKMAAIPFTLDICDNGPYFRAFLFWAFGIYVAWSLWSTIYTADRRA